jgi:hypothetical protein
LSSLPLMMHLNLSHCKRLTDACMPILLHLPLQTLKLSGIPHLSDTGVGYLTSLGSLRRLELVCCPLVSGEGLMQFPGDIRVAS